jgi:membrane-associated PAP2 superfamily phosphatase
MHRTGLIVALGIAAVTAVVFGLFPALDLKIAGLFYGFADAGGNMFAWRLSPTLMLLHNIALNAGFVLLIPIVAALVAKLFFPRMRMFVSARATVFLIVTMLLGPGLLVNVALKDHWGRPRPIDVTQYGGTEHFVSWWDPRGDCPNNCSFVSGDVSTVAWTFAPAALLPSPWQPLAFAGAAALTVFMGVIRIMAGGHFPSDAIFAGAFTYLLIWVAYALIYRWPATRLDDKALEAGLARLSLVSLLRRRTRADSSKDA